MSENGGSSEDNVDDRERCTNGEEREKRKTYNLLSEEGNLGNVICKTRPQDEIRSGQVQPG